MSFFSDPSTALTATSTQPGGALPLQQPPLVDPISVAAQGRAGQALLFVDGSVADYQQLVAGATAGTEVHVLDPVQDAVTQITKVLLGREGISSLHIVSHGEAGGLDFGSSELNLGDLPGYAAQVQSWGQALTDDADILLYGCDVAQGELGKAFVQILGQLTGADVAASDDLTGSATLGGNWTLEYQTGRIEAGLAFSQSVRDAYTGILPTYTEGSAPIVIDPLVTYTNIAADLNGGSLTATLTTNGSPDDRLSILSTGGITLNGRIVSYQGNAIGTYTQLGGYGSSNPLVVNFTTANATPAAVQALLRAIAFSNTSQNPSTATRSVDVSVFDTVTTFTAVSQTIDITPVTNTPIVGTPTILYTPNGTNPGTQGWQAGVLTFASETPSAGSFNLNTTSPFATYAGYGRIDIPLDRTAGYVLNFTAQVPISTTAASAEKNGDTQPDRAGFSVILVNSDLKAIELGFLANRIFAQEDGTRQTNPSVQASNPGSPTSTLFTQAESVAYNTNTQTNYSLTVQGNTYTLAANGTVILTGNLRDYSAAPNNPPLPNPYIVPNTIFFGDDTTSASASVNLGAISITGTAPISVTALEDTATTVPPIDLSGLNLSGNITATVTSNLGTITVNPNIPGGVPSSNITNNGTGNVTLTGTFSQLNALLKGSGLTYQGNPDVNGSDSLTLTVSGASLPTGPVNKTIPVTIVPVNDRPSFTVGADQVVTGGVGVQTTASIPNFASFNPGAANEAGQTATYTIVSNSNPNLFAFQPTIAPNGTLTYTTADTITAAQAATITVQVQDNGGTANGGIDTSTTQSFTITVNLIGQPPVIPPVIPPVTPSIVPPYIANDYDGDGRADLLITRAIYPIKGTQPTSNTYSLRLSSNTVLEIATLSANFQLVSTGDYNGDGKTDLLWLNTDNNTYSNWFLNGNTYIGGGIIATLSANFQLVFTGDCNGDGKADLLWKDSTSNTYSTWFLNGNTYIGGGIIATLSANFQLVSTADYNGDGKADLLWKDTSNNTYSTWFLNGNTYIGGGTIATLPVNFQLVSTVDYNGDGKADLLWKDSNTNTYSNWFLNGNTYIGGGTIATLPTNFEVISSRDYNSDGKADLLWLNQSNGALSEWFLDGFTYIGGAEVATLGANDVVRR